MVGHPCSNCGKPSPAGETYFSLSVYSLIDLMQEFFHKDQLKQSKSTNILTYRISSKKNSKIAVVIFFAILREVLLEKLLYELMIAQNIPENVRKRLFDDNFMHKQRMEKLFPTLVGIKWKRAVSNADSKCEYDYKELDRFVKRIADARNRFLHRGIKYAISENMAEECIRHISPLLNLYVFMHNEYVVPYYNNE